MYHKPLALQITAVITLLSAFFVNSFSLKAQNHDSIEELKIVSNEKFKVRSERRLKKQLNGLKVFENSLSGLCVYDVEEGKYVVQYNDEKYFTPASNTKLFSYYTAELSYGDRIPAFYYVEKQDSLIIWGNGSPAILNNQFDDSISLDFLAETSKNIYLSDSNFLNDQLGAGWAWDDYNDYYSKEMNAFPVYGNSLEFTLYPDRSWTVEPKQFRDSVIVMGNDESFKVKRHKSKNIFALWLAETNDTLKKEVPFITSYKLSAQLLKDTLKKEISLISRPMHVNDSINTLYTVLTDSVSKIMLRDSDNYLAESMLLMSAGNFEKQDSVKSSTIIKRMKQEYLSDLTHEPKWVDGSGLSRYNLFTPRSMVEILIKIRDIHLQKYGNLDKLFCLLPTGGKNGTLDGRFNGYPPFVHAKTGTLSNNHNLSGYLLTKSGKLLIFSYMNNHYMYRTSTVRAQTDIILEHFYLYYR